MPRPLLTLIGSAIVALASASTLKAQKAVPGNCEQLWTTAMLPEQHHISIPSEWIILPPDGYDSDDVLVCGNGNGLQLGVTTTRKLPYPPTITPESASRSLKQANGWTFLSDPKSRLDTINGITVIVTEAIVKSSKDDPMLYRIVTYETQENVYWINLFCPTRLQADWQPSIDNILRSLERRRDPAGAESVIRDPVISAIAQHRTPPVVPTALGAYGIVIDNHFSIDIGDDWERHRENGASSGILFRGKSPDKRPKSELFVDIGFDGILSPEAFFTDAHAKNLTNALIEDTKKMFDEGEVKIANAKHRMNTVSGINAMQIDISASYKNRALKIDFLARHTYLLFGDGRLYRVTVTGSGPGSDFRIGQIINSIIPLVSPVPGPAPETTSGKSI